MLIPKKYLPVVLAVSTYLIIGAVLAFTLFWDDMVVPSYRIPYTAGVVLLWPSFVIPLVFSLIPS